MLIDGNSNQNGIHTFRRRMNSVQRVAPVLLMAAIFLLSRKILFNDQHAVPNDQDAVNILVSAVPDLAEQVLDLLPVQTNFVEVRSAPPIIHLLRNCVTTALGVFVSSLVSSTSSQAHNGNSH